MHLRDKINLHVAMYFPTVHGTIKQLENAADHIYLPNSLDVCIVLIAQSIGVLKAKCWLSRRENAVDVYRVSSLLHRN